MNSYLRQQAEVLLALSRQTIDLGMAGRLRKLAADFHERASALERYKLSEHRDPITAVPNLPDLVDAKVEPEGRTGP